MGARLVLTELENKGKSYKQLRKIRQYEEDFDPKIFVQKAHDILVEAQSLLPKFKDNEDRLHDLVTEKAYPIMVHDLEKRTLKWRFLESIEAPRVMHIRTTSLLSEDNVYGQVTVRFYTKQMLAVYDRFGRLLYGSEKHPKDVLEYVVFEKHLADELGKWRVHDKIIPEWLPPLDPVISTLVQPDFSPDTGTGSKSSSESKAPAAAASQALDASPQTPAARATAP